METKLGACLLFEKELGVKESAKLAAKAGFKFVDFDLTGNYDPAPNEEEKFFKEMRKTIEGLGMKISQTHAPFLRKTVVGYSEFTDKAFIEKIKTSIRRAEMLGAKYSVLHLNIPHVKDYEHTPYNYEDFREENFKRCVEVLLSLKDTLKEHGITALLENCVTYDFVNRMHAPGPCASAEDCNRYLDAVGDENFGILLDAGHLNLVKVETAKEFVSGVGKRLKALHLHDNFGMLTDWHGELDRHLPPFIGCLDWKDLADSLKAIGYDGVYSFECSSYGKKEYAEQCYAYIYRAGKDIFYPES